MSKYTGIQKEAQLKNLVFDDYFDSKEFSWEQEVDNIDFIITNPKTRGDLFAEEGSGASVHYLWAEAKKDTQDIFEMLTQLIITGKKTYNKGEHLAPPYIGCFDTTRIAFVDFHVILPIFTTNDFNWNTTPSNHEAPDFQKAMKQIKDLIGANFLVYNFGSDDWELKKFIKTHIGSGSAPRIKSPITKDNFQQVFVKWLGEVRPKIDVTNEEWRAYKKNGILECDFYLADMMSLNGNCISKIENLKIVLEDHRYKFKSENEYGRLSFSNIGFTDEGAAYTMFWARYERPPAEVYQKYIIERHDLLVPQNIREMKGSFFTPEFCVQKSQEYIAKVFGDSWQDEYYVWDCAAGTGNLLAGLTNKYNVWASTIDNSDIERINALIDIDEALNLLPAHVFQFDFLNDSFDKLPEGLRNIIADSEKRKKLIVYINPPYAEGDNRRGEGRSGVAFSKIQNKYSQALGYTKREVYIQFLARMFFEISGCKIGEFSTLTGLTGPKFIDFRNFFTAKLVKCFIVPAYTFDNVTGKFPIGFKIWDTAQEETFHQISADVFDEDGIFIGEKTLYTYSNEKFINDWTETFIKETKESMANIIGVANDFQHQNTVCIERPNKPWNHQYQWQITKENFIESCLYYSVRKCIEHTWVNHNDQFLFPNDNWKSDEEFKINCLMYVLFGSKNFFSAKYGANHWIPFTEEQVDAKENFESNFMSNFLKGRTLSEEAQSVLDAGLAIWQYYHKKIKSIKTADVNASFYDIRAFFQGRDEKGKMNNKSTDDTYTKLLGALQDVLKMLTLKIQPKVYEYGFLKE